MAELLWILVYLTLPAHPWELPCEVLGMMWGIYMLRRPALQYAAPLAAGALQVGAWRTEKAQCAPKRNGGLKRIDGKPFSRTFINRAPFHEVDIELKRHGLST